MQTLRPTLNRRLPAALPEQYQGAPRWPTASEKTRNFPAPSRSRNGIGSTRSASTAGCAKRRGLQGTADRPAVQGRPVQSDLSARHARSLLCDAPQAVRQIAAVGACGRPRVPRHRRASKQPGFPVARAYALCTDDNVIGSAFYIMSMEEGRVFWDPSLPTQTPDARREIFTSKIETLAHLHNFDPEKIGLVRFRPARKLFRAPGRPLDQAISRLRDPAHSRSREADRVAAEARCPSRSASPWSMATIASTT